MDNRNMGILMPGRTEARKLSETAIPRQLAQQNKRYIMGKRSYVYNFALTICRDCADRMLSAAVSTISSTLYKRVSFCANHGIQNPDNGIRSRG